MGETSHVKLWAIIAPIAALAGLAWLHFKRKRHDNMTDDGKTVRHVTRQIDPKSSKLPKTDSVHSPDTSNSAALNCSSADEVGNLQKVLPAEIEPLISSLEQPTDNLLNSPPTSHDELSSPVDETKLPDNNTSEPIVEKDEKINLEPEILPDVADKVTVQKVEIKESPVSVGTSVTDDDIFHGSSVGTSVTDEEIVHDATVGTNVTDHEIVHDDPVSQEVSPETPEASIEVKVENCDLPVPGESSINDSPVPDSVSDPLDSPLNEESSVTSDVGVTDPSLDSIEPEIEKCEDNDSLVETRPNRADSGFKTMTVEEAESKAEEIGHKDSFEVPAESDADEAPLTESDVPVDDECRDANNDSLIFEYEGQDSSELPTMSSEELVEVQTAPGRLTTDLSEFEEALASVQAGLSEPNSTEDLPDQSYDIISASSIVIDDTCTPTIEIDSANILSTITEITEDRISGEVKSVMDSIPTEPTSGISGAVMKDALLTRTRTDSERIEEADWTNSPIMKLKNTPVMDDARPKKETPAKVACNGTDTHKRPSKMRLNKTALKSRFEACEEDRDSTTTPDSTKDVSSSQKTRAKKPKKRTRDRKKKKAETKASGGSTATNEDSEVKDGTSSDSGTHTDDNVERYMEISGFPSSMIGALIGKKGKNIQSIQTQSNCRILIKDYPVENGGQYISIEGIRKNINKAISILREKFPDVKISQMEQPSPTEPEVQSPEFYPQNYQNSSSMTSEYENVYDYNEMYMGSLNNISDQIDLVEGVPVEVRVTSLGPSYNELWLQPYTHPTHDKFCRLEASMSDFYSRDTELSILTNYIELGSYAMCLHHSPDEHTGKELSKWYRVQIVQYPDDLHATVMYLDFGGYGSVPIEMLRKIMQEFLPQGSRVPFQAIHAELEGLQWNDKFDPDKVAEASAQLHYIICKAPVNSLEAEVVRYDHVNCRPLIKLSYNVKDAKVIINRLYGESVKMMDYRQI